MLYSIDPCTRMEDYGRPLIDKKSAPPVNAIRPMADDRFVVTPSLLSERDAGHGPDTLASNGSTVPTLTPPTTAPVRLEGFAAFFKLVLVTNEKLQQQNFLLSNQDMQISKSAQIEMSAKNEELVRKAAEQQGKASKIMKILGPVLKGVGIAVTVLGVVAGLFTGGAGFVLAGLGLLLMAGDGIDKAVSGTSFMDQAMEKVMKPLGKAMEGVGKLLEKLGVPPEIAQIVGSVIVAIALVAAIFVIGKCLPVGKIVGAVMKKLGMRTPKMFSSATAQKALSVAVTGADVGQAANTGAGATGSSMSASYQSEAAKLNAKREVLGANRDVMSNASDDPLARIEAANQRQDSVLSSVMAMQRNNDRTCRTILAAHAA